MRVLRPLALLLLAGLLLAAGASAVRVKDVAAVQGVRENQIIGYGLVVGLNGTGDKTSTVFTARSLASLLSRLGITVDPEAIAVKNVAAVMVTASLPPFARNGSHIDALISSMGDATSLEGGTLVMTPLFGTDGEVYAIAQGPISVGGFSAGGGGGSSVQKNHPTVGRVANGATIERELAVDLAGRSELFLSLAEADFTTARRAAQAINRHFSAEIASARDSGTLHLQVPESRRGRWVEFVAEVEAVEFEPDARAVVVLNERTGTVVMGADVRISTVAVAHGSLSITIGVSNTVSQPAPFGQGDTVEVQNQSVETLEEDANLMLVGGVTTIAELVRGLNAMGVTPRDLVAILQAIKASGALSADLELI